MRMERKTQRAVSYGGAGPAVLKTVVYLLSKPDAASLCPSATLPAPQGVLVKKGRRGMAQTG